MIPILKYLKDSKGTCSTFFEMVLCRGWSIIITYIVHPSKECASALSETVLRNTDFKATLRALQIPGKGDKGDREAFYCRHYKGRALVSLRWNYSSEILVTRNTDTASAHPP